MAEQETLSTQASDEQLLYAKVLEIGMYIGLLILFVTYLLYVFGIIEPFLQPDEITKYWSLPVHEYTEQVGMKIGWGWVSMVGYGDVLNFVGIAILAGISILCYAAIVPSLLKRKDHVYAGIAVLEILVLVLAASGILAAGH